MPHLPLGRRVDDVSITRGSRVGSLSGDALGGQRLEAGSFVSKHEDRAIDPPGLPLRLSPVREATATPDPRLLVHSRKGRGGRCCCSCQCRRRHDGRQDHGLKATRRGLELRDARRVRGEGDVDPSGGHLLSVQLRASSSSSSSADATREERGREGEGRERQKDHLSCCFVSTLVP